MLLVIDVGNTNIVLGVYKDTELLDHWRISTDRQRTTDEYGVLIRELFYFRRAACRAYVGKNVSTLFRPFTSAYRAGCKDGYGYPIR